jgi:type IV secretion system protein TrbC
MTQQTHAMIAKHWLTLFAGLLVLMLTSAALAGSLGGAISGLGGGGGGDLPWNAPVRGLASSYTDVIAPAAIIISIVVTACVFAFRGDLDGMGPRMVAIFIAGASGVGATAVLAFFGGRGGIVL